MDEETAERVREFAEQIQQTLDEEIQAGELAAQPPPVIDFFKKLMGKAIFSHMAKLAPVDTQILTKGVEVLPQGAAGASDVFVDASNDDADMTTDPYSPNVMI